MKRAVGVLLALLAVLAVPVEAQEMIQYFMIPVVVVGGYRRGPAHIRWTYPGGVANPGGVTVAFSCKDYGAINNAMVCAVNADAADLTWLSAQDGVYTWPTALDARLSQGERSALTSYLEAQFVPANWILPSDTRREALRTITGMYLYMQRLTTTIAGNPLEWGITLNTQYRNMTPAHQVALETAAISLGYTWNVAATDTIRNILKAMSDAWGDQPIHFGFTTL